MSIQEIWDSLTESEKTHLRAFDRDPHSFNVRPTAESLISKGLVKWGWDSGHVLTPHGRVILTSQPNPFTPK